MNYLDITKIDWTLDTGGVPTSILVTDPSERRVKLTLTNGKVNSLYEFVNSDGTGGTEKDIFCE